MKRILIALIMASIFCSLTLAQTATTILKDSAEEVEFIDTPDDSTYVSVSDQFSNQNHQHNDWSNLFEKYPNAAINGGIAMAAITLGIVFAFPLFIIFIAFYFRYKNRKARYKIVEQALAAGQPIPEGLFKESLNLDTRSKGIKNICLGIGLFIFLWAITNSFGVGTIGLLILFTGIGQWLVARNQNPTDEQR